MRKFLLGLLWLLGSVYLGYRLTGYSFSRPLDTNSAIFEKTPMKKILDFVPDTFVEKLPVQREDPAEWYASQSPATQDCLRKAVGEKTFQEALAGKEVKPSPLQVLAIGACLK